MIFARCVSFANDGSADARGGKLPFEPARLGDKPPFWPPLVGFLFLAPRVFGLPLLGLLILGDSDFTTIFFGAYFVGPFQISYKLPTWVISDLQCGPARDVNMWQSST